MIQTNSGNEPSSCDYQQIDIDFTTNNKKVFFPLFFNLKE